MPELRTRRWIHPQPGDTLQAIADRELGDIDEARRLNTLQSWNLHVIIRPIPGVTPGTLLGSDVVYLEAPLAE